jgi:DNA-3-methyladenine glycosylase II
VAAKTAAGTAKKAPANTTVKRALNGASAHAPAAKRTRASRAKANGVLPAGLAGDVQELAREGQGEVVRKTRASAAAGGEGSSASEVAVPVQIGGLTPEVTRPDYWDKACADLVKRDRILKKLIPKFGPVHLLSRGDPFVTLARSVVGQQISVASAQAVWAKVEAACPKLVPQQFIKLGQEKLTACGLSRRKAEYVLDLAEHFVSGALHVGKWTSMEDEAVIAELTQIRGIGRWTAEMFLIFNLSRPDVLPLDDLGLIRAISVNYFSGEPVTRSEAREVAANWEPWRTVATWYMWRSLDPLPVDY